jgi:hypothetical protein
VLLPPMYPAAYQRTLTTVHNGLTETTFNAAHDAAIGESVHHIIAVALGDLST